MDVSMAQGEKGSKEKLLAQELEIGTQKQNWSGI